MHSKKKQKRYKKRLRRNKTVSLPSNKQHMYLERMAARVRKKSSQPSPIRGARIYSLISDFRMSSNRVQKILNT